MFKVFKFIFIFMIITSWIFSGWPATSLRAEEATSTPPDSAATFTPEATSALTTSIPETAAISVSYDFPINNLTLLIKDNREAKIDLSAVIFNLPPDAGELELYAIQDGCPSASIEDIKRNILICPQSQDPIGFALLRPNDYTWIINRPMRIVIGACRNKDIDCVYQPEDFLIGFISNDLILPNMPQGRYPVASLINR
jgi:hypothetical protein